ncbi:MAG: hypothetical protein RIC52_07450 [Amphiplicatus sp.]
MVDKPEDSETQISGGGQPKPEKAGTPPEVDAEIVEDGYRQPESDNLSAKPEPEETSAGAPPPKDLPPTPSSALRGPFGLSPGVMLLIVLVAVLVVGFAIWRLASGAASTQQPAAVTSALPESDTRPSEEPGEASAFSESVPASARPAPDPGKIANTGAATAKEAATGIEPSESSDASGGLPLAPAAAAGGNETLQNAAKKAAKTLSGPDTGDAIDLGDTEAPASGEEIEAPAPDAEAHLSSSDDPASSETPAEASDQGAALPGADKIANDLTEMKAALAAAQILNAQQADEIAAMRDGFQQALAERDRNSGAAIASLSARLDKIQPDVAATPRGREAAASLALVALQRVIDSGAPYQAELDVLSGLAPGRPALEALRARAETGAPTLLALKADFPAAARAARAAANRAKSKGPVADFFARLETLISIRPAAPIAGGSATAIISRAEDRLDKDMLAAAVTELEALPAPSSDAFSQWLADARARLAADQAIADMNAALLADFVE